MEVVSNGWHVIGAGLVFLIGAWLALVLARRFGVPQRRSLFLYFWHTAFSMAYMVYSLDNVADATGYYLAAAELSAGLASGTDFVKGLTWILVQFLGLSYLGCFLVFNIVGFLGLLILYGTLRMAARDKSPRIQRLAYLVVLLPSISFWTAAVGKDAIAFLAVTLFLWGAVAARIKSVWYAAALITMLVVRPHISAVMMVAIVLAVVLGRRMGVVRRFLLGTAFVAAGAVLVPFALDYVGMGEATNLVDVNAYIETRQGYNQEGGGSVDISSMNPVMQLFTYMFRPLPYEARSLAMAASSVDNLVLLLLTVAGIYFGFRKLYVDFSANRLVLWFYSLPAWLVLAITTANLGISVRQKWMIAPVFLYLLITMLPSRRRSRAGMPTAVQASEPSERP